MDYKGEVPNADNRSIFPLWDLAGVGAERKAQLQRLGLATVGDLFLHRPRRYEDRRHFQRILDLRLNEPALACGKIVACGTNRFRRGGSLFEIILDDGSARLHCRWWNLPFMERYFATGDEVVVFGRPNSLRPRTIDHPETEVLQALETSLHLNRIVPIYPLTEGLPQRWLRSFAWRVLEQFGAAIDESRPGMNLGTPSRAEAIRLIHFPSEMGDIEVARRRLALDEYIELQRAIQTRRKNMERNAQAIPCPGDNHLIKPFLAALGFHLTDAQTAVLREIRHDMRGPHPMRRLLQGDVGSGKTVVAACAALMALESGLNVAVMAPTEILAEQHARNFRQWFEPLGIAVELRTGGMKTAVDSRQEQLGIFGAKAGDSRANKPLSLTLSPRVRGEGMDGRLGEATLPVRGDGVERENSAKPLTLWVGTHALLEKTFAAGKLGLVIIDEQHKFGVAQRETLVRKGSYPHLLVMTATPIPRTLGLTLYGDLDISVLGASPPGRGRIKTFVREVASLPKVWKFVGEQLAKGRQAYIVYSRLEEEDSAAGVKAVQKEFEKLQKVFTPQRLGLLHGRLKSREKEQVMAGFRENQLQVLVATSVVEVGLDVPNATVMVIENAEQFGLAQLHQLRGRVGRGAEDSYCILIAAKKTEESAERLKIMEATSDGFEIAEADLRLRGPGELVGREQSGAPPLVFGNLAEDISLIEQARELVRGSLGAV